MASIRVAEVLDAAAIAHVHVQSWVTTYEGIVPTEYLASLNEAERVPLWRDWLTRDICVFVAEIEGKVIGFAGGGSIREAVEAYDCELYTLYLLKEAQGRGVGKALLCAVMQALSVKGYASMLAWVLQANPAVHFYQRVGAQRVTAKSIEIGGIQLSEVAFGWSGLGPIVLRAPLGPSKRGCRHLIVACGTHWRGAAWVFSLAPHFQLG